MTALTPVSPGAFSATTMKKKAEEGSTKLKALIYGPHGAGKTTLCASAVDVPEMGDVWVLTVEGGDIVFQDNERIVHGENLVVTKIDRIEQFQKAFEWLKIHVALRDQPGSDEKLLAHQAIIGLDGDRVFRFNSVVVDSLSEVEALMTTKVMRLENLALDAGDEMEVAGWPEFRKNLHLMQRAVRQFRDLDIHVMMTCAQAFSQDERKAYHYGPKLTGQLSNTVQGFFDLVGWLVPNAAQVDEKTGMQKRYLFIQPQTSPKADAKCRLAAVKSAFFDNPTMTTIMGETGLLKTKAAAE